MVFSQRENQGRHDCLRLESFLPLPLGEVARQSRDGEGIWRIRRRVGGCWRVLLQLPPPLRGTSLL